jgi:hypothetical protein
MQRNMLKTQEKPEPYCKRILLRLFWDAASGVGQIYKAVPAGAQALSDLPHKKRLPVFGGQPFL